MTTGPIAAARALIAAQPDLLFRCDLCPDESNCHPHHDMSMSGEYILCDECEDFDNPKGVPDPLALIAALADALEAEQAKVAAAYEAAAGVCALMAEQVADAAITGLPEQARLRESMEAALTKAAYRILDLTPDDALGALGEMLAEARLEGWRADLVEALEAENQRLREALQRAYDHVLRDAPDWFMRHSHEQQALEVERSAALSALRSTEGG